MRDRVTEDPILDGMLGVVVREVASLVCLFSYVLLSLVLLAAVPKHKHLNSRGRLFDMHHRRVWGQDRVMEDRAMQDRVTEDRVMMLG